MLSKNGKFIFYTKDDDSLFTSRIPLMKRRKNYWITFQKELRLRNRSALNRIKKNEYFDLHHALLCLNICRKKCAVEGLKRRKLPPSIEGLNCDQINDYLFASQRLTNKILKENDLINKFKKLNIGLIVNCQEEGEHPCCGDTYYTGLDKSGFSYSIEDLKKNDIQVINSAWVDLTVPDSFILLIKIAKTMYYYIHTLNKKVIVHCHAGYGRTAITLVCYLIYAQKLDSENARKEIRKGGRKRCLNPGPQYSYCQEFGKYLEILRENFFKNKKDINIFKISEKLLDVGNYKFTYFNDNNYKEYVPIFLLYIFDRIIQIKKEKKIEEKTLYNALISKENNEEEELKIEELIKEINKYNWDSLNKYEDLKILGKLLFKWLNNSINYVINPEEITLIDENNYSLEYKKLKNSLQKIIECIGKFLYLIKDDSNNSNINNSNSKEFIDIFIPSLLGYSLNDGKNKNIEKLINLIDISINNFYQNK